MRFVVIACLALAVPAHADGFYFTESFGGSDVKSELSAHLPSAVHVRIGLGMRSGAWAVETHIGAHIGFEGVETEDMPRWQSQRFTSLTVAGVDLKYIQPITKHVETYLRGGLTYGWIPGDEGSALGGYAGRGVIGGAGVQLKGKVRALGFLAWPFFFLKIGPKVTGALWLDASYGFLRLHPDGRLDATPKQTNVVFDAKITTLSGGFAIGSDF